MEAAPPNTQLVESEDHSVCGPFAVHARVSWKATTTTAVVVTPATPAKHGWCGYNPGVWGGQDSTPQTVAGHSRSQHFNNNMLFLHLIRFQMGKVQGYPKT